MKKVNWGEASSQSDPKRLIAMAQLYQSTLYQNYTERVQQQQQTGKGTSNKMEESSRRSAKSSYFNAKVVPTLELPESQENQYATNSYSQQNSSKQSKINPETTKFKIPNILIPSHQAIQFKAGALFSADRMKLPTGLFNSVMDYKRNPGGALTNSDYKINDAQVEPEVPARKRIPFLMVGILVALLSLVMSVLHSPLITASK